ncbi:Uncharacterized protein conserved in bacteria [Moraxella lacunata]|uniref:Uncharacterized protein conserved in bacteria n=1 Tax=Moraxella lacunata TaxID=477 RepID=A0A378T6U4_MORLA|nr:DUF1778 domain-containing protein [Moraxella lacunata]STZ56124.1 Uncharacterized protein conserved in bacteria [Moraxella lacunata]
MQATERINLRTTPHMKAMIEKASRLMGVSMSHYIATTMYEKSLYLVNNAIAHDPNLVDALDLMSHAELWELTNKDNALIKSLLDTPTTPNDEMKALMAMHDKTLG